MKCPDRITHLLHQRNPGTRDRMFRYEVQRAVVAILEHERSGNVITAGMQHPGTLAAVSRLLKEIPCTCPAATCERHGEKS